MHEIALNGILHIFALFATLCRQPADAAERLADRYLRQHLGLLRTDDYLGLFREFLDLYDPHIEPAEALAVIERLCGTLRAALPRNEQVILFFRLLELLRDLAPETDLQQSVPDALAAALEVSEKDVQHLRILLFTDGPLDTPLDGSFLLIDAQTDAKRPAGTRCYRPEHFQGSLLVLRLDTVNLVLFTVLQGDLTLNDRPVPTGVLSVLEAGSVFRDARGHAVYSGVIERMMQGEDQTAPPVTFSASHIEFRFPGSEQGLHDFSFSEQGGHLVGIMGGSGVGKTTLLNILNGTQTPDSGNILLNGFNIYHAPERIEGLIGYVPQDDLLIDNLTVYQNLYYNAKLCMAHLDDDEIRVRIETLLEELNQLETRDLRVGSPLDKTISGGQRKRLNIALELLREPPVLFVDEPTSGLSSSDSANVMSLLRSQAVKGRLVFVIIHQPSSDIFRMFDQLWILDRGGYPIFTGNPLDAVRYFRDAVHLADAESSICPHCGYVNPEQIFNLIETRALDQAGHSERERRYSPRFWHERYLQAQAATPPPPEPDAPVELPPAVHRPSRLGQMAVFLRRTVRSRLADKAYLLINLLEAPVLGWATARVTRSARLDPYIFGDNPYLVTYFFMIIIVALFMGLSVSAEEIVSDRRILRRERFLHLSWGSYISGKILFLMAVSAIQMLLCAVVGVYVLQIPDMTWKLWAVLFSCAVFANVLGLNISSAFKTSVAIYILIPVLLIPQMLLSGLVIRFDDLRHPQAGHAYVPPIGDIMVSRWALEALVVEQFQANRYQREYLDAERDYAQNAYLADYLIPELRSKADFIFLKTDLPKKDAKNRQNASLVRKEITSLAQRSGIPFQGSSNLFESPDPPRTDLEAVHQYLDRVSSHYREQKAQARKRRQAVTQRLLEQHGGRDGLQAFKKQWHNTDVEDRALRRNDLEIIRTSGESLVWMASPVYQPPQSPWGRAVFMAGSKRLGTIVIPTFTFNLGVIWLMTSLLTLALLQKWFSRILPSRL